MVPRSFSLAAAAALVLAAPLRAQDFDPSLGVEAVAVLEGGRLLVNNADAAFDCALQVTTDAVLLNDCQPRPAEGDAVAGLAALSAEEWQALVREAMVEAECKLSAVGAAAEVVTRAAEEKGVAPEEVEKMRAHLSAKAETAVDSMMKAGKLSVMDGELVLYDCP